MADALPNPSMDWNGPDRPQAYKEFKQLSELWFKVRGIQPEDQHSYIILWSGREGLRMYNTWGLTDDQLRDPKNVWDNFSRQIEPKENFRIHRLEFQRFKQSEHESVDDFYTRCKVKAMKCQFTGDNTHDERMIEVLISGIRYHEVQKKLLGKDETLRVPDALDVCRTHEASVAHMAQLSNIGSNSSVDAVRQSDQCKRCGGYHPVKPKERCPAYGTKCKGCGKEGHWKMMCRGGGRNNSERQSKYKPRPRSHSRSKGHYKQRGNYRSDRNSSVHTVHQKNFPDMSGRFESLSFDSINSRQLNNKDSRDELFAELDIKLKDRQGVHTLKVKVDSGAQGNILPLRTFRRMFPKDLDSKGFPKSNSTTAQSTILTAYNGTSIPQYGSVRIRCRFEKSDWLDMEFFVAESDGPVILGLPSSRNLKLITMNCAIQSDSTSSKKQKPIRNTEELQDLYPECFEGIGRFPGKFHITLKEGAQPVVQPARKYPIQLKDNIKEELDRMEILQVITKVTEPTDWVSSLAFSRKENGRLRICLDPKDLNRAMKRTYHKTPTLEEITHKFSGAQVFSKLDARHGYWSIMLDEESSYLTTFNSPFGRYRFLRLAFGLKVSQDIFQEKMDMILEQCPGTLGIADDVAVFGKDDADHDRNLHNLMCVAHKYGLIFNIDKCEIKVPCIKFFGCYYDKDGARPDPAKVEEIYALPPPSNVNELQQFLGLVQYMSPFIPKLADHTDSLRKLTHKDTDWQWSGSHQADFHRLKSLISTECTLTYFDPRRPTVIQVDSSLKGLGAALLQDDKPVAFASKALTDAETRYANIERELLAVVFGCTRFHTYVYGSKFIVESDHKPLENIQHKSLASTPPRLQRMMLRLQPYDMEIVYKPGRELLLADAMSRLNPKPGAQIDLDAAIYAVQFSTHKLTQLKEKTNQDEMLHLLKETIISGWPEEAKQLPRSIRHYWSCRDELSVDDGMVIKGERIIIPESMREETLGRIHAGHQGVNKCQLRAKTCVYWPGINKEIERIVGACNICQGYQNSQSHEPLMPREIPQRPWQIVGTDLFQCHGAEYLIVADYYSKYPFVRKINGPSTSTRIVDLMKELFSEQGIPSKVFSDNGPQYDSYAFRRFTAEWGFEHVTSSPRYPRSNGFVERMVGIVKPILQKARKSGMDPDMAMLCLRSTPVDNMIPSPAELLYSRQLTGNLPVKMQNTIPRKEEVEDRLRLRQEKQKEYHDRQGVKELPPLVVGQRVTVQDHQTGKWSPAVVIEKCQEPRSYLIKRTDGQTILRRNRKHLREVEPTGRRVRFQFEAQETEKTVPTPKQCVRPAPVQTVSNEPQNKPQQEPIQEEHEIESQENPGACKNKSNKPYHTRSGRAVTKPKRLVDS